MKKLILFLFLLHLSCNISLAQLLEENGYLCVEMESTKSPLGKWVKISAGNPNFIPEASGGAHLEFTGNGATGGAANSPIEFTFKITNPGTYGLTIRASKRLEGKPEDNCNDCYVRMKGDFSSPYPGDGTLKPDYAGLTRDEKLFGGLIHPILGWANTLDYLGSYFAKPKYVFKAGQTYTVTFSGRSQRFNMDFFILYNESFFGIKPDIAQNNITPASKGQILLDVKQINTDKKISIFPNPTKGVVKFSESVNADFYNSAGQKVKSVKNASQADLSSLPVGIYQVKVNNNFSYKLTLNK